MMVLIMASVVAAMTIAVLAISKGISKGIEMWQQSGVVSTPTYQAQNLEVLRTAQPNDLIICIIEGEGSGVPRLPRVVHAIIIDQNANDQITGSVIRQHAIEPRHGWLGYSALSHCEVRVLRPPATFEAIGRIYTYGIDFFQLPVN
ncbi:MAG: hypothetical protein IPJ68_01755 [Candidatus Moraniibacteriota bacterium]|nr:MAG: hypothetical protein IPJ68_01755 [Candidatus Moranbacteria bacterium]